MSIGTESAAPKLGSASEPSTSGLSVAGASTTSEKSRSRRLVEGVLFVAIWMSLGFVFRPGPDAYLLLGVPLTAAFQLLVRRRPLRELWLRQGPALRFTAAWGLFFVLFAIAPAVGLVKAAGKHVWIGMGWELCALVGAGAAAYAAVHARREPLVALLKCLAIGGVLGCGFMLAGAAAKHHFDQTPFHWSWLSAVKSFLSYWAVCFVLEEVCFRGALDSHLYQPGESGAWPTAILVGVLWGLWHLPIVPIKAGQFIAVAAGVAIIHTAVGIPLSLYWRRSGNLAVPAFTHAFIDAVRNALGAMG